MLNAMTVDVEDYYHVSAFESVVRYEDWHRYESRVERNTHHILDILDKHQTKATFFVLGWIAERHPRLVLEIDRCGHEIACHGYSHKLIYKQTETEFREETKRAKCGLEEIIQKPVLGYRAASYSITAQSLWALDILAEEGFRYDSSIFPIWHDRYGIPGHKRFPHVLGRNGRAEIIEFPLTTIRIAGLNIPVGGGGYLRLFPYAVTRWAILHLNGKEKQPAIIYLHPWELDPDQPRIKGLLLSRFRHYMNLDKIEERLRRLIEDFRLGPVTEVLRSYADRTLKRF